MCLRPGYQVEQSPLAGTTWVGGTQKEQVRTLPQLPLCMRLLPTDGPFPLFPFTVYNHLFRGSYFFPNITGLMTSSSQCNFSLPPWLLG